MSLKARAIAAVSAIDRGMRHISVFDGLPHPKDCPVHGPQVAVMPGDYCPTCWKEFHAGKAEAAQIAREIAADLGTLPMNFGPRRYTQKETADFTADAAFFEHKLRAGTNGLHGGDAGHGSLAYFMLTTTGEFEVRASKYPEINEREISISAKGDEEVKQLIQSLRWGADALERIARSFTTQTTAPGVWPHVCAKSTEPMIEEGGAAVFLPGEGDTEARPSFWKCQDCGDGSHNRQAATK